MGLSVSILLFIFVHCGELKASVPIDENEQPPALALSDPQLDEETDEPEDDPTEDLCEAALALLGKYLTE